MIYFCLNQELGTKTTLNNTEVVTFADVIFLSVKPHLICDVIAQCKTVTNQEKLYVSVAAGVTLETMGQVFIQHILHIKILKFCFLSVYKDCKVWRISVGGGVIKLKKNILSSKVSTSLYQWLSHLDNVF